MLVSAARSAAELAWESEGGRLLDPVHRTERLEWAAFHARFYADRPKHDGPPLAAYEQYRTHQK
jgi:hypothetical protein